MTDLSDWNTSRGMWEVADTTGGETDTVIPDGGGIKVGPDPNPEPPEPYALSVEFTCSDGSTHIRTFEFPPEIAVQSMTLNMMRGLKSLGPILRTHFWMHDGNETLHTICRRTVSFDELPPTPEEIAGPSNAIDQVTW